MMLNLSSIHEWIMVDLLSSGWFTYDDSGGEIAIGAGIDEIETELKCRQCCDGKKRKQIVMTDNDEQEDP